MLLGVRNCPGIREGHSLYVVERDPQERRDSHHLVKWRSIDATELPAFDRSGADADDLAEAGPRVAGGLAPLLQEPSKSVLFERHERPFSSLQIYVHPQLTRPICCYSRHYRSFLVFQLMRCYLPHPHIYVEGGRWATTTAVRADFGHMRTRSCRSPQRPQSSRAKRTATTPKATAVTTYRSLGRQGSTPASSRPSG